MMEQVFHYLARSLNYGITYQRQYGSTSQTVTGDSDTRHSVTCVVFNCAGSTMSWLSRLQSVVALSAAEAGCFAMCEAAMEAASLRNIAEKALSNSIEVDIGVDNSSAITLAMDPTIS